MEDTMASQQLFDAWIDFETETKISWRPYVGCSTLKDKYSKYSSVYFLKERG